MGLGAKDEENPPSEDEVDSVTQKLNPPEEEAIELRKIPVKTKDASYPEVIAGHSDPIVKASHLKYLLLGFNFLLSLLGLCLFCIALWVRVDPDFWEYDSKLNVDNLHGVCIIFILASLVIILVSFVGCFGASTERRTLIIAYIGIFGIIFLLQIVAVIIMWMAPYSKTITKELEDQLKNQIYKRNEDDSSRYFIDYIQSHLRCCGATTVKDYADQYVPNSCQDDETGSIYKFGCAAKMLSFLRSKAGIIGGLALPILLLQMLALLAAGYLIRSLDLESRYFM